MKNINFHILGKIFLQKLQHLLFQDGWRKSSALLLALFCWFLIFRQVTPANRKWDTVPDIPIYLRPSPDLYIPEQNLPSLQIKIAINYSYTDRHFFSKDFFVQIDPSQLAVAPTDGNRPLNKYKVVLSDKNVLKKPEGVSILGFDPPEIFLSLDKIVQVQKDLNVRVQGTLRDGYDYTLHPVPSQVTLQGPSHLVNQLTEVETRPLQLNFHQYRDFITSVQVPSPVSHLIKVFPDKAEVQVNVENTKTFTTRKFNQVPLYLLTSAQGLLLPEPTLPQQIEIILQGRKDLLKQLEQQPPRAYLNLASYTAPGNYNIKVQLSALPPGVALKFISPANINVKLEKRILPVQQ